MIYEAPASIEQRSFEIITEELHRRRESLCGNAQNLSPLEESILKRVIHTTADFDFAGNLVFINDAAKTGAALLRSGAEIITDTQMAMAGVNKKTLAKYGGSIHCFIADEDVAAAAKERGTTRAAVAIDKAAALPHTLSAGQIFAIGNAPTALLRIHELTEKKQLNPALVIAVPVGFVNVTESKTLFLDAKFPCIIAQGRKGGSAVAAAIINAMLYGIA